MEYASKSVGTAGLTTGIIGTALGALAGGSGLLGLGMNSAPRDCVTKDELNYVQTINSKDCEISLLKSEQNTEIKIADVYERLAKRINDEVRAQSDWNAAQAVNNAQMSSAIAVNANSIAALQSTCNGLTKTIIPITNVCPEPMKLYNSWTAPTT